MKKTFLLVILGLIALNFKNDAMGLGGTPSGLAEAFNTSIVAMHSPIYPTTASYPTYSAVGNAPTGLGIKRIRIKIKAYPISVVGGIRVIGDTPINQFTSDCTYPEPYQVTQTCSYTPTAVLPENTQIWYRAIMRLSDDSIARDRKIRHTARLTDAVKATYDWAYYVYRRGIKSEKFNVLFVGDVDYGSEGPYITDIGNMVFNGLFSSTHILEFRRFFNFYMNDYATQQIDFDNPAAPDGCGDATAFDIDPPNWDDLSNFDVRVYVHATDFQDCASLGLGEGRRSTADGPNVINMEMLHALAGLDDEYVTTETESDATGPHQNVFNSSADCVDHASTMHASTYTAGACTTLGAGSSLYHWDPNNDIMTDSGAGPLQTEEWSQILALIGEHGLSAFSVVPPSPPSPPQPPGGSGGDTTTAVDQTKSLSQTTASVDQELDAQEEAEFLAEIQEGIAADNEEARYEKTQKTVSLRLLFYGPKIKLERTKIIRGPAPHIFFPNHPSDYLISLLDHQRNVLQKFWTQDPRRIGAEEQGGGPGLDIQNMRLELRVPWQSGLGRLRIQNKSGQTLLEASILAPGKPTRPQR